MNAPAASWSAEAFEARYRHDADPWRFASCDYEQARYRTLIDALLKTHYRSAFEPGCSVGELTAMLGQRCDAVYATDVAPSAVAVARQRCRHLPNVRISCEPLSDALPCGPFDLIVMSEVLYYFSAAALARIASDLHTGLMVGGELIAVHWLGRSEDHRLHGDEVHEILLRNVAMKWVSGSRYPGFRIDSWVLT